MSTSSGEAGYCTFCGHLMNEHTKASRSKCKKCKKRFIVCQAPLHESAGWRICDIPCGCGSKHYPSSAKEARPLKPTEYATSHPQYESPSGSMDLSYVASRGDVPLDEEAEQGQSSSHTRTASADSVDPLQWDQERYTAETLASAMSGLTVESASYQRFERVPVSARFGKNNDTIVFKPQSGAMEGYKVESVATCWAEVEDGYIFASEQYGCEFFAKEIKRRKK